MTGIPVCKVLKLKNKGDKRAQKKRRGQRALDLLRKLKAAGCSRCGERHIACLDWHHLDENTKWRRGAGSGMADLAAKGSVNRLLAEIEKCVLLCANCHRKEHYDQRNRNA